MPPAPQPSHQQLGSNIDVWQNRHFCFVSLAQGRAAEEVGGGREESFFFFLCFFSPKTGPLGPTSPQIRPFPNVPRARLSPQKTSQNRGPPLKPPPEKGGGVFVFQCTACPRGGGSTSVPKDHPANVRSSILSAHGFFFGSRSRPYVERFFPPTSRNVLVFRPPRPASRRG